MKRNQSTLCTVLFLCTGNYYRSRFAEVVFNTLAREQDLQWTASSRGLAIERGIYNVGPISAHAVQRLKSTGIALDANPRFPLQALETDLADADLIVALKESEHRSLLAERYPQWPDRVEYWHIDDLDIALPGDALAEIEQKVAGLVKRLSRNGHDRPCNSASQSFGSQKRRKQ